MNAGVVYLHRPYANILKMLLPYYEITCEHHLEETMLRETYMSASCLLKNVHVISEGIKSKNQEARRSSSRYQGNGPKTNDYFER